MKPVQITLTARATVAAAEAAPSGAPAARTITGRIVTYGAEGTPDSPWARLTFDPGSVETPADLTRVKMLVDHDMRQPVGVLREVAQEESGADATFRMGSHAAAQDAVALAADGIRDGLSVGVDLIEVIESEDGRSARVVRALLREVSLVSIPAYADASVTDVSATRKDAPMTTSPPVPGPPPAAPTAGPPVPAAAPAAPAVTAAAVTDADLDAALVRVLAQRAPAESAPLLPALHDTAAATGAVTVTSARVVDRDGYSRTLPAVVHGRERVDAADYLAASVRLMAADDSAPWERVTRVLAAAGVDNTSMVPGLLPQVIVGPILDRLTAKRPVWSSLAPRTMPSTSKTFERLRITQQAAVGEQAAEGDELASQALKAELEQVVKATYGGYVNLTRQVLDWTTPGALEQVIYSLTGLLVRQCEIRAVIDLVAAATQTVEADLTDPAQLQIAAFTASAKVWGLKTDPENAGPDRVWMSLDMWAQLGGMTDKDGRALHPALSPSNAMGTLQANAPEGGTIWNMPAVPSVQLPAKTLIIGQSEAIEVYEDQRGMLQAVMPSTLQTQVASYAYATTYPAHPKRLVKLTQKAAPPEGK